MTTEPGHRPHRREGCLQPIDRVREAKPSKIAGCDNREKIEPDVGRGRAVRDDRLRRPLLKVVRRQPVFFRGNEGFKEAPRAAGDQSRKRLVFFVQKLSYGWSRLAHEVSDQWRKYPDDEERAYFRQCARLKTQREAKRGNR